MSDTQSQQEQQALTLTEEQKQAWHGKLVAQFNNLVDTRDMKFSFKTDKETGFKRPTVELRLPIPSVEGIVDILQNGATRPKEFDLLLDAVAEIISDQARSIVNDDESINQDNFPFDKVTWAFIANMPKAERRGGGIAKETWEDFAKDYCEVMPAATGKKPEQVATAAKLFVVKFAPVKTQKPVIQKLVDYLGIYVEVSPNAEQYTDCIEFLTKKAETLLNMSDEEYMANL